MAGCRLNCWAFVYGAFFLFSVVFLVFSLPFIRDESRFAQTSYQISETGDFFKLHMYKGFRLRKPPVFYWLQYTSFRFFSVCGFLKSPWMFRLPSALFFILCIFFISKLSLFFVNKVSSPFLVCLLFSGSFYPILSASVGLTDTTQLAFALISFYFFYLNLNIFSLWRCLLFLLFLFLATLVKTPLLFLVLVPFWFTAFFLKLFDRRTLIKNAILLCVGLLGCLLLYALYNYLTDGLFLTQAVKDDFLSKASRFSRNPDFFILTSLLTYTPTYPLFLTALYRNFRSGLWKQKYNILLLVPILVNLSFFECLKYKNPQYLLLIFPFMVFYVVRYYQDHPLKRLEKTFLSISVLLMTAFFIFIDWLSSSQILHIPFTSFHLILCSIIIISALVLIWFLTRLQSFQRIILAFIFWLLSSFLVFTFIISSFHQRLFIGKTILTMLNSRASSSNYAVQLSGDYNMEIIYHLYDAMNNSQPDQTFEVFISTRPLEDRMPSVVCRELEFKKKRHYVYINERKINEIST